MRVKTTLRTTARVALAAAIFGAVAVSVPSPQAAGASQLPDTWALTGSMSQGRGFAPAVKLGDGSVVTAGGTDGLSFTATAERWTTSGRTWTAAGSIGRAVAGGVGALLPNGKALFAGGAGDDGYYGFGDLYTASGNSWTQTPAMAHAHAYGAGAQLSNGNVLVIAGMDGGSSLTTNAVDLYSASGNTWSAGPALPGAGRYALTATTLSSGKILVAGGNDGTSGGTAATAAVSIYTDGSGWASADAMNVARFDHSAVRLLDGRILVAGGSNSSATALASAEIYDPGTGHWTLTGSMGQARYGATLTRLNNGWVLATGGYGSSGSPALASAELFDPSMGIWTPTGSMQNGRRYQSAALLSDGTVLVAGGKGMGTDPYVNTAEVYMPPLAYPATTFHPVLQTRIMDTRTGLGLTGRFGNRSPRALTVIGAGGVPPSAIAVTGIVTVTQQTVPGFIAVGPSLTGTPGSSTLNFPLGDNRANNVTAALDQQGRLQFVFCAPSLTGTGSGDILFDVTGYFTADDSGATFKPLTPARVMDSRDGTGLPAAGAYVSKSPKTTTIWGAGGVPAGAVAVTGNLTVAYPSSAGWAYVGTSIPADPATLNASVVNAQAGEIKADGITVGLTGDGKLSFVWVGGTGSTVSVIFDVTGYFVQGLGGARFVPLDPIRVADTRIGLPAQGPMKAFTPIRVPVGGNGHLPRSLVGLSGNLTVVGQSVAGYLTVAPIGYTSTTPTSTLNFPLGDIRANGFYVSTAADASIGVTFLPTTNTSTHFVMDVTGYFLPVMS